MIDVPWFLDNCRRIADRNPFKTNKLTIGLSTLGGSALANLTLLLEIEVPALLLTLLVLEVESNDSLGLVDGVLALRGVGLKDLVNDVESGGGGESVWMGLAMRAERESDGGRTVLERHGGGWYG